MQDGKVIGFSASSYLSHGFNKSLIKCNLMAFGLMAIKLLFKNPQTILRIIKNLDKRASNNMDDDGSYAELYSIAVLPECQGLGVGRLLLIKTEEEVTEHNSRLSLTTDYFNNDKTIAFYRRLGYKEFYDFIAYPNRRMWRMIKNLNNSIE